MSETMASSTPPPGSGLSEPYSRKQAHPELADPPSVHSATSLPRTSDRRERDWANLTAGPAGQIAEFVLSEDLVDLVQFRAVCRAWRACSAGLRARGALDRRFYPRRWIMLPNVFNVRFQRRFMSVRTGERVLLEIPGIHRCFVLGATSEGLLLVCRTDTYVVQLVNAMTGQTADLPHAATLLGNTRSLDSRVSRLDLRSAGFVDESTVVLHLDDFSLATATPGGESWTRLRFQVKITSALPFAGRVYCATARNISVVKATGNQPPELVAIADHEFQTGDAFSKRRMQLMDNDGELIISNYRAYEPYNGKCMAYRVKLDTRSMVPLARLDGKALFTGTSCSLLVAAGVSPAINADTVYFCGGRRVLAHDAHDLLGGSVEPCSFNWEDAAKYYLSIYVCRP